MELTKHQRLNPAIISVNEKRIGNTKHQVIPNNHIRAIFNLGTAIERKDIGTIRPTTIEKSELLLTGCQSRAFTLSGNSLHYIEVCIDPLYSRLIFHDITGCNRNESKSCIDHKITNEPSLLCHLNSAYDWQAYTPDKILKSAIKLITESKGEIKVSHIYETLQISKSHLEQKFSHHLGLTAKEFCKIEKLKNFLDNYMQLGESLNLTQLTFKSGYYDQSHLIKDFRYFTDSKPRDFLNACDQTKYL